MFAPLPRTEITVRMALIAVILFSVPAPTIAYANPSIAQIEAPTAAPTQTATETSKNQTTPVPTDNLTEPPNSTATTPAIPTPLTAATSPGTSDEEPILQLFTNPSYITLGSDLMLTWEIADISFVRDGFILKITIPETLTLQGKYDGEFDPSMRTLTVAVTNPNGGVQLKNEGKPGDAYFEAYLSKGEEVIAKTSLLIPFHEQYILEANGGEIWAMEGRIKIEFPKDALPEKVVIEVGTPIGDAMPKYSLLGKPFEIKAHKEMGGESLKQFSEQLSITVSYADLGIPEQQEGDLHLHWYDTNNEEWVALPTFINKEDKTITALTDHFTVFDIDFSNWQATRLPTVDSFQVSEFTGAGTYSYPIEVPPGPGGFQPNIALTYNSQIVDQSTLNTQASWVGMGWSLETGSIMIDERREPNVGWEADTHLLRAYPNNPAARKAMSAQAKCRKAR